MDSAINEVKDLKNLILSDNTVHNKKFIEIISNIISSYDTEAQLTNIIASKDAKINSLKEELTKKKADLVKVKNEMLLVKGRNFEINQHLVKIVEEKYALHVDYMSKILYEKLKPLFDKFLSSSSGVTNNEITSQQGEIEAFILLILIKLQK